VLRVGSADHGFRLQPIQAVWAVARFVRSGSAGNPVQLRVVNFRVRPQVASVARAPIYSKFAQFNFLPVRSAVFDAEAHIPTQPSSPLKDARISFSHEDQERAGGAVAPARQGTQARLREGWPPRVNQKTGAPQATALGTVVVEDLSSVLSQHFQKDHPPQQVQKRDLLGAPEHREPAQDSAAATGGPGGSASSAEWLKTSPPAVSFRSRGVC
jgi:hypothetical protein